MDIKNWRMLLLTIPLGFVIDGLTTPGLLAGWVTLLLLLHVTKLTKVMSSFDIITISAMSSYMLTTYSQTGSVRTITRRCIWPQSGLRSEAFALYSSGANLVNTHWILGWPCWTATGC